MIAIIGAGPVGSYAAYLLAKKGKNVTVFEEHKKIGKPVQCTGILSDSFSQVFEPCKKFVINRIDKTRIHYESETLKLSIKTNYVIDRTRFDNYVADMAKKAGAKYMLGYRLQNIEDGTLVFRLRKYKPKIIIGADGPVSIVSRSVNPQKTKYFATIQARVKLKNDNVVDYFPFTGGFGWIVPENSSIARIGVAAYRNPKLMFKKILRGKIIEMQGGPIPVYDPKKITQKDNTYLVGDAAGQVKATTGGGIVPGLIAAKCLAEAILQNRDYVKLWKNELGKKLWAHLMMRNIMDRFSEKDWKNLIRAFSEQRMKKILESESRDNPFGLCIKILMSKPWLLLYGRYLV